MLRLISRSRSPLTIKAIADGLDLVPSTVLHTVRALVAEGLLQVDPDTKQYRLGVGLLPFARALLERSDFPNLVRPKLDELSLRHGVTALATEAPNLRHMIVVAISQAPADLRVHINFGSRLPGLVTSTGRCLAAFGGYAPDELERQFKRLRWVNGPSYEAWLDEVEQTRRLGYDIDLRYIPGLTVVAVPVLNGRGVLAYTLGAVGISSQVDREQALALARDMRAAAEELAAEMPSGA